VGVVFQKMKETIPYSRVIIRKKWKQFPFPRPDAGLGATVLVQVFLPLPQK
jgi:hypothetical protein